MTHHSASTHLRAIGHGALPARLGAMPRAIAVACLALLSVAATPGPARAIEIVAVPHNNPDLNAFIVKGTIEEGDELKILRHLADLPKRKWTTAYLYSPGGHLLTGLELGRIFRDRKVRTIVQSVEEGKEGVCASACALAFLGGTDPVTQLPWRTKASNARLGFHSFSNTFPERNYTATEMALSVEISQRLVFEVVAYMQDIDLSLRFVPVMFKAQSTDMNWISNREAIQLGIHVWDERLPKDQTGLIPGARLDPAGGTLALNCPVEQR